MFWRKPPPLLPNTSSVTLDTPTKTSVTNMITQSYHDVCGPISQPYCSLKLEPVQFTATSTNTQPQDGVCRPILEHSINNNIWSSQSSSNFHLGPVRADSNPITQSRHDVCGINSREIWSTVTCISFDPRSHIPAWTWSLYAWPPPTQALSLKMMYVDQFINIRSIMTFDPRSRLPAWNQYLSASLWLTQWHNLRMMYVKRILPTSN